jgi:quercetin dioxygenase-like cupin family protein
MEVEMSATLSWSPKKLVLFVLAITVILASAIFPVAKVGATPGSGVTGELIASGTLPDQVPAKFKTETGIVQADVSKITVIRYTIAPGGVFGWHQHGGPLWATVLSGNLTIYHGDDPTCSGEVYPSGSVFMDAGNHTHNARNEGTENLVVIVTFMLPEGGAPRIDVPSPGNCSF